MSRSKVFKFIISISICQAAGVIGSLFTSSTVSTWYLTLQKPSFSPPNWVFAPVWTILFLLMGISLYLIWSKGFEDRRVKIALFVFGVQLVLNILWSFFFFSLQSPFYAYIEILVFWHAILITTIIFYRISKLAGLLLLPYILWVTFAAVLNCFIWNMNL